MARLPQIGFERTTSSTPQSSVSLAERVAPYRQMAEGLDAVAGTFEEAAVDLASAEGANAVFRDEEGNLQIQERLPLGRTGRAYNRAARAAFAARLDGDIATRAQVLRQEANRDPEAFRAAYKEYADVLLTEVPRELRGAAETMLDDAGGAELRGMLDENHRRDILEFEGDINARIDAKQNELEALARRHGVESPQFERGVEDVRALYDELAGNPEFAFTEDQAERAMEQLAGRSMAEALIGEAERAVDAGDIGAARRMVDVILNDETLDLQSDERRRLGGLAEARINERGEEIVAARIDGGQLGLGGALPRDTAPAVPAVNVSRLPPSQGAEPESSEPLPRHLTDPMMAPSVMGVGRPLSEQPGARRPAEGEQTAAAAAGVSQEAADQAPIDLAATLIGRGEVPDRELIKKYLENGGVDLDPATVAWCAAFVNATLAQMGIEGTGSNLARSFLDFGEEVSEPQRGDLAIFERGEPWQGHVGFVDRVNPDGTIRVLGGNQDDAVGYADYSRDALLGFRRLPERGGNLVAAAQQVPPADASAAAAPASASIAPELRDAAQLTALRADPIYQALPLAARNRMDARARSRYRVDTSLFEERYADHLTNIETFGQGLDGFDTEAEAAGLFPPEEVTALIAQEEMAAQNFGDFQAIRYGAPGEALATINAARPRPGTPDIAGQADRAARFRQAYEDRVAATSSLAGNDAFDPADYARRGSPGLNEAYLAAESFVGAGEGALEEGAALWQTAFRQSLAEQERLGVVRADRRVLSAEAAERQATSIMALQSGDERVQQFQALKGLYGRYFDRAFGEIAAAGLDSSTELVGLLLDSPFDARLAASVIGLDAAELQRGLGDINVNQEILTPIEEELAPFMRAFEAGNPTRGNLTGSNRIVGAVQRVALQVYRQTRNQQDAIDRATALISNNWHVIESEPGPMGSLGALLIAPTTLDIDGRRVPLGQNEIEAGLQVRQTQRAITEFDPAPITDDPTAVGPIDRSSTIAAAANNGIWMTNAAGDGAALMIPFPGGGFVPVVNSQGARYEVTWDEIKRNPVDYIDFLDQMSAIDPVRREIETSEATIDRIEQSRRALESRGELTPTLAAEADQLVAAERARIAAARGGEVEAGTGQTAGPAVEPTQAEPVMNEPANPPRTLSGREIVPAPDNIPGLP